MITFDDLGLVAGDEGTPVGSVALGATGITATFENAIYAQAGSPTFAFSTGTGLLDETSGTSTSFDESDNWFITDMLGENDGAARPSNPITVSFNTAVSQVSFDVADLDGFGGTPERLTATALDADGIGLSTIIQAGNTNGFGDGLVGNISFDIAGIRSLVIDVAADGNGFNGYGIDNITATPVPEPSALAGWAGLTVMGLFGVGLRRRRKRQAA